jgi:hypothetical protein
MSYIGQTLPADTFQGFVTDKFTGDGTANKTFTLSKTPFNESAILVTIDGVVQEATDDFTVSGTTLTLVGTAPNNSEVNAIHIGGALPIGQAASLDLNGASDQLILDADADTTISADTDDQIDFKVGGSDVFHILGSKLIVADTASHTDDFLQIESPASGGGHGIQIRRNDTNTDQQVGRIQFGNNSDVDLGIIACKTDGANNTGAIVVSTANAGTTAERFRVTEAGIHIGGTGDANALDDYEEGSWTAQLVGATSGTYAASTATYVKVGRVCTVNCMFTTTIGNNVEGNISLQTLPFAPDDSAYVPIAPYYVDLPADASGPMHIFLGADNTTSHRLRYLRDGQAPVDMVGDHIANAAIYINFTYEVN